MPDDLGCYEKEVMEQVAKVQKTRRLVDGAEKRMVEHGGIRFVSLWWCEPHVMGVLADGRTIIIDSEIFMEKNGS